MNDPTPARPDKIDDILRLYCLVREIPALPLPTTSPARATFDYRHVFSAWSARLKVAGTETALARAFGVTFTEKREAAGDDTPRYLLEAELPSGLVLVIASRVQTHDELPSGVRADTGELVAA